MSIHKFFQKWFWSKLKTDLFCFFNPQQEWLTKKIPNTWVDKDFLIQLVLFDSVVHFIEQEKGYEHPLYDWSDELAKGYVTKKYVDELKQAEAEILSAYNYIKNERPNLEKQIDDIKINPQTIKTYLRLEKQITKLDTNHMCCIIKNRHRLWT